MTAKIPTRDRVRAGGRPRKPIKPHPPRDAGPVEALAWVALRDLCQGRYLIDVAGELGVEGSAIPKILCHDKRIGMAFVEGLCRTGYLRVDRAESISDNSAKSG